MRRLGPTPDKLKTLEVETALNGIGAPIRCDGIVDKALWLDSGGGTTVTGAVQVQGSVGGDEWVDVGSPISTWPSYTAIAENFTHLRLKTTTAITTGVPRAFLMGNTD